MLQCFKMCLFIVVFRASLLLIDACYDLRATLFTNLLIISTFVPTNNIINLLPWHLLHSKQSEKLSKALFSFHNKNAEFTIIENFIKTEKKHV